MKIRQLTAFTMLANCSLMASAADPELEALKQELRALKAEYLEKIEALEQRIGNTESTTEELSETLNEKTQKLAIDLSQQANRKAPNTYNPGIGLVLNGQVLSQSRSDYEFGIPGFTLPEESGPGEAGLLLGESELNLSANVDDKFYASTTIAFGEGAGVEEAYLQTLSLPSGLRLKFGRFFSGVGYLNSHHAHTDAFASRPLAYQTFLGGNYGDDGVQLTWLAPTDLYWESGVEVFRGDGYPAAGASNRGVGAYTLFTHLGGDIGFSSSWRAGISYLSSDVTEREYDPDVGDTFTGDSKLWIADAIWKWAPDGNPRERNAMFQAEYFQRSEEGEYSNPTLVPGALNQDQSGWYAQGIYQFMPRWRVGLRYDRLSSDDAPNWAAGTAIDPLGQTPEQTSLMLDFSNSEFSRIRFQFSQDDSSGDSTNLFILQYTAAFGAHGAHAY